MQPQPRRGRPPKQQQQQQQVGDEENAEAEMPAPQTARQPGRQPRGAAAEPPAVQQPGAQVHPAAPAGGGNQLRSSGVQDGAAFAWGPPCAPPPGLPVVPFHQHYSSFCKVGAWATV